MTRCDEVVRVHLVVGRHHAGDVDPLFDRAFVAGDDRGADAAVALVRDHDDAGIGCGRLLRAPDRSVARRVVDDIDAVDEARNHREGLRKQQLLVVRGDDDRDALAFDHRCIFDVPASFPSRIAP